ncbi:UDP-N-acetylmuramate dehydrogenase [Aquifex sp.]
MLLERDFLLKNLTSIKIGGRASYYAEPKSLEELSGLVKLSQAKELPLFVLGNGSNTILGDIKGVVVHTKNLSGLKLQRRNGKLTVEALSGTPLKEIIKLAVRENLKGIYKLLGFPASVGGAISMNAGAFGTEISEFLKEVYFLSWEGELIKASKEELEFSYRKSPFPKLGIIYKAVFEFEISSEPFLADYNRIRKIRKEKQPINLPTSGSTFKNPEGDYAGRLLERAGLKGFKLKELAFSEKHANFLINLGNASFSEAKDLIALAKEKVYDAFGVILKEEVKLIESSRSDGWKVLGA